MARRGRLVECGLLDLGLRRRRQRPLQAAWPPAVAV